jgi:hypothetical protein
MESGALSGSCVEDGLVGSCSIKGARSMDKAVHLVEEKMYAHLDDEEEKDYRRWVLDTGATNHMIGCRSVFSDLDHNIHDTVKFRDGSVLKIGGMGTTLFNDKNGEHQVFTGVYFIHRLTTNIISVGQLDEIGYQTLIEGGVMRIRDAEYRLLVKVHRSINQLYVLEVEIDVPVCLAMWGLESVWLWHAWFRHLNFPMLHKLTRDDMVRGLSVVEQVDQICSAAWLASIAGHPSLIKQSTGWRELWSYSTEICVGPSLR